MIRATGFAGGGTLGINWQAWNSGLRTRDGHRLAQQQVDLMSTPTGGSTISIPSETNRLNYLGTVRGRLGLAVDRTLLYVTAGLAYGEVANTVQYNSFSLPDFQHAVF